MHCHEPPFLVRCLNSTTLKHLKRFVMPLTITSCNFPISSEKTFSFFLYPMASNYKNENKIVFVQINVKFVTKHHMGLEKWVKVLTANWQLSITKFAINMCQGICGLCRDSIKQATILYSLGTFWLIRCGKQVIRANKHNCQPVFRVLCRDVLENHTCCMPFLCVVIILHVSTCLSLSFIVCLKIRHLRFCVELKTDNLEIKIASFKKYK